MQILLFRKEEAYCDISMFLKVLSLASQVKVYEKHIFEFSDVKKYTYNW